MRWSLEKSYKRTRKYDVIHRSLLEAKRAVSSSLAARVGHPLDEAVDDVVDDPDTNEADSEELWEVTLVVTVVGVELLENWVEAAVADMGVVAVVTVPEEMGIAQKARGRSPMRMK